MKLSLQVLILLIIPSLLCSRWINDRTPQNFNFYDIPPITPRDNDIKPGFRNAEGEDLPTLPSTYHVIGPFPAGVREQGGDVLEAFGGVAEVYKQYLKNSSDLITYPSELADGGEVRWKSVSSTGGNVAITYEEKDGVRWQKLTESFGPSVIYFSGWAVGNITTKVSGEFLFSCIGCGGFYLNNKFVRADPYRTNQYWSLIQLSAGTTYTIYIPIKGYSQSNFQIGLCRVTFFDNTNDEITSTPGGIQPGGYFSTSNKQKLSGSYISIPLLNKSNKTFKNFQSRIIYADGSQSPTRVLFEPRIEPKHFQTIIIHLGEYINSESFKIELEANNLSQPYSINVTLPLIKESDPIRFSFLDADNSVQYAIALRPLQKCTSLPLARCPIIVTTHGAGSIPEWLLPHYPRQQHAWVLSSEGRGAYAYDWSGPQFINAATSLTALSHLTRTLYPDQLINKERILFTGHSMGGHGCFVTTTHLSDYAVAGACAAGWIRFENYLPFYTRTSYSFADNQLRSILESAIGDTSPDLYLENSKSIPLMVRTGGDDEDVNPYHSRRMARINDQLHARSNTTYVSEIPHKGHWFDEIVAGDVMQDFFTKHAGASSAVRPKTPIDFAVQTMTPSRFAGRGGIRILQSVIPYRLSKMKIKRSDDDHQWTIKTLNVKRFGFYEYDDRRERIGVPKRLVIDGDVVDRGVIGYLPHYMLCLNKVWSKCDDDDWYQSKQRSPSTYGPLVQILDGALVVVYGTLGSADERRVLSEHAHLISEKLAQQGRHSVTVIPDVEYSGSYFEHEKYNVILLGGARLNKISRDQVGNLPVVFETNGYGVGPYRFEGAGVGVVFLSRFLNNNVNISSHRIPFYFEKLNVEKSHALAVVVDGLDDQGFRLAFGLLPLGSGLTVPDFAVVTPDFKWKSYGGLAAAGYWGNDWEFDERSSYVDTTYVSKIVRLQ
ncbi:hypothetical protein AKO1_012754 [Acrasis kona]|uniref:Peptidase S9 prolyl oligopeptidase catalytic domain-containing protein n=1 Tax=Acrasis kona TaxID=1008807 RepID=A0AAW2YW59_9EUKA